MNDNDLEEELATFLSSSSIIFGGDLLSKTIRFGAFVIVTRTLAVPDFGSLSLALVVFQIASTLSIFGQNNALQHFFPTRDTESEQRDITQKSLLVTLGSSLVVMAAVVATAGIVARLFETPELVPLLYVAAITLPATAQFRAGISITRAFEMTKPRVYLDNVLFPVSRLGFVAVAAVFGLGAIGMMSAYLASYVAVAVAVLVVVYRRFETVAWEPSGVSTPELVSFSVPLVLFGFINMVTGQVDKFLLGLLATNSDVGVFNVAFTISQHLLITLAALRFIFTPMFARLYEDADQNEVSRFYRRITRWGFYSTVGIVMVVVTFAEPILAVVFKPTYTAAADTLRVLAAGYAVVAFFGMNDDALLSMGFSRIHAYGAALVVLVNAGVDFLLIPRLGVFGAGLGTAAALLVGEAFFSAMLYRQADIHVFTASMVVPAVVGAAVPVAAILTAVLDGGVVYRTVLLIGWGIAFLVAILVSGGLDERDREIVRTSLVQTWNRVR